MLKYYFRLLFLYIKMNFLHSSQIKHQERPRLQVGVNLCMQVGVKRFDAHSSNDIPLIRNWLVSAWQSLFNMEYSRLRGAEYPQ